MIYKATLKNLIWSDIEIDTVKEYIVLSNVQSSAASEIETAITQYVMKEKKKAKENSKKD